LYSLDRLTFNSIVKDSASKRRTEIKGFISENELFKTYNDYEQNKIADAFDRIPYKSGEFIINEGESGENARDFYLIEQGSCYATKTLEPGKPPERVMNMGVGNYFGERSLISNCSRGANVIAETDVYLLVLDRRAFKRMLGPMQEYLKRNMEMYAKYCGPVTSKEI
jgi:cAMP-dependent protein kinase regulator